MNPISQQQSHQQQYHQHQQQYQQEPQQQPQQQPQRPQQQQQQQQKPQPKQQQQQQKKQKNADAANKKRKFKLSVDTQYDVKAYGGCFIVVSPYFHVLTHTCAEPGSIVRIPH
jgi:hypothetical protein